MFKINLKPTTNIIKKSAQKAANLVCNSKVYGQITKSIEPNPFVMDAKAMLVKFNVEKPNEIDLNKLKKEVYDQINPIKAENFEKTKSKLYELFEKTNPDLAETISNSKDPSELFATIKEKSINKIKDTAVSHSEIRHHKFNSLQYEKQDNEFQILKLKIARSYRAITELLTPKSTNPEVIKLEQQVKALGVKDINFSDDIKQAQTVKSAIEDLIKAKIPLPHSITITPMLEKGAHGMNLNFAKCHKENGYIYLSTSKERNLYKVIGDIEKQKNATSTDYKITNRKIKNWSSTQNSKHTIYHEMAHTFQPSSYFDSVIFSLTAEERNTVSEISEYARNKMSDAMPEMFAMLMDGQKLSEKQMALYTKLGGIVPQL